MCESGRSSLNGKVSMKASTVNEKLSASFAQQDFFEPRCASPKMYMYQLSHYGGKSKGHFGSAFNCPLVSFRSGQHLVLSLFVDQSSTIIMAVEDIFKWLSIN